LLFKRQAFDYTHCRPGTVIKEQFIGNIVRGTAQMPFAFSQQVRPRHGNAVPGSPVAPASNNNPLPCANGRGHTVGYTFPRPLPPMIGVIGPRAASAGASGSSLSDYRTLFREAHKGDK
jgi:hypothetical protein